MRTVDFLMEKFDFDGFLLEVSGGGHCRCKLCGHKERVEYFSGLCAMVAEYIRGVKPDLSLIMNMCGFERPGFRIDRRDWHFLEDLSSYVDAIIDGGLYSPQIRSEDWSEFASLIHSEFGTSGGTWVYPPQRWSRLRWFLPYTKRTGAHLAKLARDHGRAVNYYLGPSRNPGVEVNVAFGGKKLMDVERDDRQILREVLSDLFEPNGEGELESLTWIFEEAESLYFRNADLRHSISGEDVGQICLEKLRGRAPGPPIYLRSMSRSGRISYGIGMGGLLECLVRLRGRIRHDRGSRLEQCLRRTVLVP